MKLFEKGPGFRSGLRDLPHHLNGSTIASGLISTIFGCTGPALVVISASSTAGFTTADTVTWIFGIYVFGGLLGLILSLYYKLPISGAYSIPGATLMGTALAGYTFNQAAGAFVIAGVIVLIIGLTGLIGKVMKILPLEIVMAMVAGCMLKFGTNIVTFTQKDLVVCGSAVLAFLLVPRVIKKFPAVLAALIVGVIVAAFTGGFSGDMGDVAYIAPRIVAPAFSGSLILSCSIPLAALVIGAENAQAMGVLKTQGYEVPANSMTIASGIGGIVSGLFGAHNANVAGPMTAICSSDEAGPKEGRYAASVVNGITFAIFGLVAAYAIGFVNLIPVGLTYVLAGLAMINVLIQSFRDGFKTGKYKTGAFTALIVGVSGISILHIGSAFWALVFGVIVSLICDHKDFAESKQ
jgi:benzoate membrane transport protein